MTNLHKIKAYLYDNVLMYNPYNLVIGVDSAPSMSVKDICESAVTRGGTEISATIMEHTVNHVKHTVLFDFNRRTLLRKEIEHVKVVFYKIFTII